MRTLPTLCLLSALALPGAAQEAQKKPATPVPPAPSSPLSAFGRPTGCIDPLMEFQRGTIVTLAGEDHGGSALAVSILWDVLLLQHG